MRSGLGYLGVLTLAVSMTLTESAAQARVEQVTLGAEDDAGPWSYADGTGYVNDVVKAAFAEVGWKVQLKVIPYPRCKALAIDGTLAGCFSASKTPELEQALLYPNAPVLNAQNLLIARADSTWSSCVPTDWGDQSRIGLVRGYEYPDAVSALQRQGKVNIDYADSEVSNLRKLKAGRIDATVVTVDEVKRLEELARLADTTASFRTVCDFGAMPAYVTFSRRHVQGSAARRAFDEGYARLVKRRAISALQLAWRERALDAKVVKPH